MKKDRRRLPPCRGAGRLLLSAQADARGPGEQRTWPPRGPFPRGCREGGGWAGCRLAKATRFSEDKARRAEVPARRSSPNRETFAASLVAAAPRCLPSSGGKRGPGPSLPHSPPRRQGNGPALTLTAGLTPLRARHTQGPLGTARLCHAHSPDGLRRCATNPSSASHTPLVSPRRDGAAATAHRPPTAAHDLGDSAGGRDPSPAPATAAAGPAAATQAPPSGVGAHCSSTPTARPRRPAAVQTWGPRAPASLSVWPGLPSLAGVWAETAGCPLPVAPAPRASHGHTRWPRPPLASKVARCLLPTWNRAASPARSSLQRT